MLESQPDFPRTDISDADAAMLELLLQNRELLDAAHTSAEAAYFLYRLGHGILDRTAAPHLDNTQRMGAFSLGATMFETVNTLVNPGRIDTSDKSTVTLHVMSASHTLDQSFVTTLGDARDKFQQELPRTHLVIGTAAARFCQGYEDYTRSGAAMAREIELEVTSR